MKKCVSDHKKPHCFILTLILALLIPLSFKLYYGHNWANAINESGRIVLGQVTQNEFGHVHYEYIIENKIYKGQDDIHERSAVYKGDTILVLFSTNTPTQHQIYYEVPDSLLLEPIGKVFNATGKLEVKWFDY